MSLNPLRALKDRRLQRIAGPCGIVLFGFTGDLARRKILPALYDLTNRGLLPPSFSIIGVVRREIDAHAEAEKAIRAGAKTPVTDTALAQLLNGLSTVQGQYDSPELYRAIGARMQELDETRGTSGNFAFYLSIPPKLFPVVTEGLAGAGLNRCENGNWRRVVIEKPFGHDAASARELNATVRAVFPEDSVFRIDHYLGKETVQNIMALRFANELYEPIWNSAHVDHVQITMAEDIGIGSRASYYDGIGATRDVIQNHLLQLLALTAMEEPVSSHADAVRAEKEKVLKATHLFGPVELNSVRAQYDAGWQGGEYVRSYKDEEGIPQDSQTDTYGAMALAIETRRWSGVPFYLRSGKRLGRRVSEIAVVFKRPPFLPFHDAAGLGQNTLVIRVQPNEGVTFKLGAKVPGSEMRLRDVTMDFAYGHAFTEYTPEAYERLILDVLLGEPPLFPQWTEVEESWRIVDQVEEYWASSPETLETYAPGTWGPAGADAMLARNGHTWRRP
ncbi:glucose-6-phosphate 1-dehydrogenase [Actinobaculum suis]|uniref:Glucose-6-phosphate 1-dehydrogenase n=1 Tax=Actinobaculum suis TaxID=1657 RepID=A0A0K9EV40_9ACTO|nr:glucose-6-phosphate dehydrogenase [Actinobaculum suis]KMY23765.1 glucose-6-phosphate dehydrogenase [Actinobaculum suis]MDY5153090.1 glucose-6-phosphate dehydrogenase [Actinobaculum suis]OCA93746.1 glucose-6-phosphate dehydrogenase [Actinobaculum suis]OCA94039.1 glucose-6-phosphate dehydrogenase [Actinobaculum suis]SDE32041.1 glucose-6-phosphate 1-dehydrogenase [Actinobaculum suis]